MVAVALVAILCTSLAGPAAVAAEDDSDRDVVTIDTEHGLADDATLEDYRSDGVATGSVDALNADLTIATDKAGVGVDDAILPSDLRNDFLRIEYREDFDRTLRIHIPREYISGIGLEGSPYSQAGVESVTTDHHADLEPVRGGEYLEVVVHVDEPSDIVLPIQRDSATSYRAVEWADSRIEMITGYTVFSGDEWKHIDGSEISENRTLELEGDPDNMVVQYDAHKEDPDETWINAPRGEDDSVGVHVITTSDGSNETAHLVATTDDPPDVRYKPEATPSDEATGWYNDAREIPKRIQDMFGDAGDILPLQVIA